MARPSKNSDKVAKRRKTAPSRAVAKPDTLSPRVQSAIDAHHARHAKRKPAPSLKVMNKKGVSAIEVDHPDPVLGQTLIMEALGTADPDFMAELLCQLAHVAEKGGVVNEQSLNFMLSVVKGIEPRDHIEALLSAQMAAVHSASMTFARRLNHVDNIPQQDSAERAFNKLTRTFVAQVEALKRYRTGGQQRVIVEHVTVNEGGQAIVGNVTHGGRGLSEKAGGTS